MSRLYASNSRGRQALFAGPRTSKTHPAPDDTYQEKPSRKRKGGAKYSTATPTKSRRGKVAVIKKDVDSTTSGESSDEEEGDDEDEDEEDENDVEDEIEVIAPPRAFKKRAAERYQYDRSDDNLSEIGDQDSMFNDDAPGVSLDDEDDDEIYLKVDDISDSDIENVSQDEMTRLETELNLENGLSATEEGETASAFYLNQIEGMSAYGFGETSEAEGSVHFQLSSQSSDDGNPTFQRHVRFEETFPEGKSVFRLSQSPTMTRALLPSALPHQTMSGGVMSSEYGVDADAESDIDSDVTDDCLPAVALEMSDDEQPPEEPSPGSDTKKTPKLKGPPTGRFIDDGDKSAGILDASGKVLIITNPHHLGEEFVRRYGPSAPASPGDTFAEAVFEDEDSQSTQDSTSQIPDPMISSLTANINVASNGQAMGPPEAWYADFKLLRGILPEDDTDFEGLDAAEEMMNLEDVIHFGSDESGDDSPMSPAFMSSDFSRTPRNQVSHLDNSNIMSFRRAADPAFAALQSSPTTSGHGFFATPTSSRNRKRKSRTDSPYSTPLYKGVTPVQRTTGFHKGATILSGSPAPPKRRKVMS